VKNIVLIGFMGVGKGTIARAFCKKTGMYAIDTDDLIESLENRKIKKIFKEDGEAYFRELEAKTATWLANNVRNTLISTGGGFFMVEGLHKIGTIVYLRSSFDGILQRLLSSENADRKLKKRPLFQEIEKAKTLYDKRAPLYEKKADIILNVEGKSIKEIVKAMEKKVKI
jgi:shikimate kinase